MSYGTLVADPPWHYEGPMVTDYAGKHRGRAGWRYVPLPYPSMSVEEITALPIRDLAGADSRLFLWTTNRHLPFAFGIMAAWGFSYRQTLVWHKTKSTPVGSVAPSRSEFLLVGRRGNPAVLTRLPDSVITASPTKHSRKPECFLDYIEAVSPGPYLELFARRNRFGWDTWGNEAFEHVVMDA